MLEGAVVGSHRTTAKATRSFVVRGTKTWTAARLGYVLLDDEGVPRETPFKIDNSHLQVGQACRGYKLDRKS